MNPPDEDPAVAAAAENAASEDAAPPRLGVSPAKAISIAVVAVLLALALVFGIFAILSKGFDDFARSAAGTVLIEDTPQDAPTNDDIPRVPGL